MLMLYTFGSNVRITYTLFTNGRQPETSTRPNMESRRFGIKISCKLWPISRATYVEIIGHLKAITLMRQYPDC